MKTARKFRSRITPPTQTRWTAYAAAAVASGFAGLNAAEAEIHYSGLLNLQLSNKDQIALSLGEPGTAIKFKHFEHVYGSSSFHDGGTAQMSIYGASGKLAGRTIGRELIVISNLPRGTALSGQNFPDDKGFLAERSIGEGIPYGDFLKRGVGYIGFKFNRGTGDQYGWARVRTFGLPENKLLILDYAYGDPGESVFAGQKHSPGTAQSLGDLAAGAVALRSMR